MVRFRQSRFTYEVSDQPRHTKIIIISIKGKEMPFYYLSYHFDLYSDAPAEISADFTGLVAVGPPYDQSFIISCRIPRSSGPPKYLIQR